MAGWRYRPYETLVVEAAQRTGLPEDAATRLRQWNTIEPRPEAPRDPFRTREESPARHRHELLERLGRAAAERIGVRFDVVVTAERAGFYKPDPAPYRLALSELQLDT